MADVQSNIVVNIDTTAALAELKALQRQISAFHTSMAKSGAAGSAVSANMQQNLLNSINGSGKFYAEMTRIKTSTEAFNTALAKNQFSMKEYFRYAGAATKTFGTLFRQEHETINKVARENVKTLQTQYIKMGRDANGALKGISVRPLALDMNNLQTQTAMAAQKQALLNQLLRQGSTNLLNFGKNTQWAGRQLMVGFTVPLMYFGAMAGKTFMQLEEQAIRFKRVYGDMFTTSADATKALKDVQLLANEFTKYGVAVADTMKMAADVAATGKTGSDLMAQVANTTRLAVLGGIDQQKSLDTIISLTSTFGIAAGDLATNIDFLNAVENQTILNIDDLTTAIPKAAPVIKQLGGNVQDLAFFMTAMREGGIDAAQGANAIKSGLASMINPTKAAREMLQGFGIDVVGIVNGDKGNVKKMVLDLATALNTLDPLNRAQAIEKMFGKFQFARISTLFQNVIQQGSQAQTVLGLTKATTEELAILSERELSKISESPMYKFKKQVQDLKVAIAPIGGEFIKALTPVLKFFGDIFKNFNGLGDGTKKFIVLLTTLLAGIGPLVLMSFGLLANGIANIIKMFVGVKSLFNNVGKSSAGLGEQTNFLTETQMQNAAAAASLDQAHQRLQQRFTSEAEAVALLTQAYKQSLMAQRAFTAAPLPTGMARRPPMRMATGGIISGSGTGKSDSIPAMLSNGEAVVPAENVKKYPALTAGLVAGNIPGFAEGYSPGGTPQYRPSMGNNFVMASVIAQNQARAAALEAQAATTIVRAARTEFAHIGSKTQIPAGQLAAQLNKMEGAVTTRALRVINALAVKFGDALMVNVYGKLGMTTGLTSGGKSINGLLGKPGGVAKSEFLTDFDKQGVNRWKTSVKAAGLKMENVTADLTVLDAGIKEYLTVINKDVAITDATVKEAYEYSTRKMAADNKVVAAFNQLAVTAGEARVNISQSVAAKFGLQSLATTGSKPAFAVGSEKVRSGGDRLPFMRSAGFNIVEAAKNAVVQGAKEALKIASPSKEMRVVGEQAGTGLIIGAKETTVNAKAVGEQIGLAMSSAAMPPGSQARNRVALYGTGPVDAEAKSVRRQLEVVAKRQLAESKKQLALDQKISQSKQQLYGTTGAITADMRTERRLRESQARALVAAERARIAAEEQAAIAVEKQTAMQKIQATKLNVMNAVRERAVKQVVMTEEQLAAAEAKAAKGAGIRGASGKLGGAAMGLSMVAMMGSMAPGKVGEISQKLMMPLMALSMIIPMLNSAFGLLAVGIGIVVAAYVMNRMAVDKAGDAAIDFAEKVKASNTAIVEFGKFAHKVSASEIMDKRRKDEIKQYQTVTGKTTFGESYVAGEQGKALVKSVGQNIAQGGTKVASNDLFRQLSMSVASGTLSTEEARSIALNVGDALGNQAFGIQVNARLIELLGPNGENYLNDPLTIRTKMVDATNRDLNASSKRAESTFGYRRKDFTSLGSNMLGGAAAGATAGLIASQALAAATLGAGEVFAPAVIGAFAAGGAALGGIGGYFNGRKDRGKRIAASTGADAAMQKIALEDQQQMLDGLEVEYQKKIDIAKASGDIAEADRLSGQFLKDKQTLLDKQKTTTDAIMKNFKGVDTGIQEAYTNSADKLMTKKYKGTAVEDVVPLAKMAINDAKGTKEQKYLLKMQVASGNIDPVSLIHLMDLSANDKASFQAQMDIITKFGGKTASDMQNVADLFIGPDGKVDTVTAKKFEISVSKATTTEEAQKIIDFNNQVAMSGGELDIAYLIKYYQQDTDAATAAQKLFDLIKSNSGNLSIDIVTKFLPPEYLGAIDKAYYDKLTANQKQVYMNEIVTVMSIKDEATFNADPDVQKWLAEKTPPGGSDWNKANVSWVTKKTEYAKHLGFIKTDAMDATVPPVTKSGGATGNGPTASPLDDLIKKIRDLRKDQQALTIGWDASMKAMNALFTNSKGKVQNLVPKKGQGPFNGLSNQLRSKGLAEGAIDFLTGLSPEDYKKVGPKFIEIDKKTGEVRLKNAKQLNALINNIAVGEFQNASEKMIKNLTNQDVALKKLMGAGMSLDDAYAAVADEAFAAAIATGNFTSAQVKQMIATRAQATLLSQLQERLKAVRNYFNDLTSGLQDQQTFSNLAGYLKESGMDASMIAQILSDPTLAKGMADQLAAGALSAEKIKDSVEKIRATAQEKIVTDLKAGNYASAFQPGYDAAQKMFDLQQRTLEQAYRPIIKADEDRIKAAQQLVKLKQGELDAQQKLVDVAQAEVDAANKLIDAENEKNDKLAHDIKLIDHAAEAINARYDAQKKALEEIASVNDYIIAQQGKQLGLADALTQGDIGAAAKAVQDMRAASASNSISSQQKALDNAQQNEIGNLKNDKGQTKTQIEAEQYVISEKIYAIQQGQLKTAQQHLDAANAVMDTLNLQMKALEYNVTKAQEQLDADQADLAAKIEALTVMGQTKTQWEDMKLAVEKAQMAQDQLAATQLAGALATAKIVDGVWAGIKSNYDSYKDKTTTITTIVNTIYTSSGGGGSTTSSATADQIAAMDKALQGKDDGTSNSLGFYNSLGSDGEKGNTAAGNALADKIATSGSWNASLALADALMFPGGKAAGYSVGGFVPKYFAVGGYASGTDTVPAMLTPGEFVMSKYAVDQHGVGTLSAMNDGKEVGNSVYTYNLSVNVKSDANPNDIAQVVMTQIKQIDAQKIRGVRR
jgi:hypothetical protein